MALSKPILLESSIKFLTNLELHHFLQYCSNSKSKKQEKQTHQQIIIHGIHHDHFMASKLVYMYAECNHIIYVHHLFDQLSHLIFFAMLALYSSGMPNQHITYYNEMNLSLILPNEAMWWGRHENAYCHMLLVLRYLRLTLTNVLCCRC